MKRSILRSIFTEEYEDKRIKLIQERIQILEKHVPVLRSALSEYSKKSDSSQNKLDKIVAALRGFAQNETVSLSLKRQMDELAVVLQDVGNHRGLQVIKFKGVLDDMGEYQKTCKHIKAELRELSGLKQKTRMRKSQLRRMQDSSPQDDQMICLAEAELHKAKTEVARANKSLEEEMDMLEQRKLQGLREMFLAWLTTELKFHTQALQLFTVAYRAVAAIDADSDLEVFRNKMMLAEAVRGEGASDTSFQRSDSVLQILATSFSRRPQSSATNSTASSGSRYTVRQYHVKMLFIYKKIDKTNSKKAKDCQCIKKSSL